MVSTPCRAWLTDLPDATAAAERVVGAALLAAALDCRSVEVGVRLTDDADMRHLNREYRQQDKATNVLSFGGGGGDGGDGVGGPAHGGPLLLGDIVLAHGVLVAEAAEQGKTLEAHFYHLLVHGTLHLLGHDHEDDDEARAMEEREIAILAELGVADPYQPDSPEQ